eukprot:SAG22_NODE_378_length_11517_cov_26.335523_8_plen_132_part_00
MVPLEKRERVLANLFHIADRVLPPAASISLYRWIASVTCSAVNTCRACPPRIAVAFACPPAAADCLLDQGGRDDVLIVAQQVVDDLRHRPPVCLPALVCLPACLLRHGRLDLRRAVLLYRRAICILRLILN